MKKLSSHNNSAFRTFLWSGSAIAVLLSGTTLVTGFSEVGRDTQIKAMRDRETESLQQMRIREIEAEAAIAKTYERSGLGKPTQNFIFPSGNQSNVLELAAKYRQSLINSQIESEPLTLLDQHHNVIGTFNGSQACNLKNDCRQLTRN